jgi:hypothetical protein
MNKYERRNTDSVSYSQLPALSFHVGQLDVGTMVSAMTPQVLVILTEEYASALLIRGGIQREDGVATNNHVVVLVSIGGRPHQLVRLMIVLGIRDTFEDITADWADDVSHELLSILLPGNELALSPVLGGNQGNIGLLLNRLLWSIDG